MKTLFVAVLFFALGAASSYVIPYRTLIAQYSQMANQQPQVTPTRAPTPTLAPGAPTLTPIPTGNIEGTLGFPSEAIPELEVYAVNLADNTKYYRIETEKNQQTFMINNVVPGHYYVVAYTKTNSNYAGGYTKAVPCGLSVNCTNHSFIPVIVKANETASGAEPRDWYAPEGTFPKKPGT